MTSLLLVLAVALVGLPRGLPRAAAQPVTTMKLAYATSTTFFHHAAAEVFKQQVEQATGGQVQVELHPGGELGGEVQILEGLRAGTIEGYIGTTGAMTGFIKELGLLDLPYLWRDYGHAFGILDGQIGTNLRNAAAERDLMILGFWPGGRRDIYGNVAIQKPEDLRGVKIRTLQTPVYVATFEAFGALPSPIAWPETYGALQQHVIDASETALSAMLDAKQDEVVSYVTLTDHGLTIAALAVNKPWLDSLPDSSRRALRDADLAARARALELEQSSFDEAVSTLRNKGKTILEADKAAFQQIVKDSVYPKFSDQFRPEDIQYILSH